jgi:hypothetical protein
MGFYLKPSYFLCIVSILFMGFFQGEFPDTDPTKFTDEELGIPPGTNIIRLFFAVIDSSAQ